MKKVFKYFSLMFALLLVLTGCNFSKKESASSTKSKLSDSLEKTDKATNFSEKVTVDFSMEQSGQKIAANATIDGKVYTEGDKTLLSANVKAGASGMSIEGQMYADIAKDSAKLYVNYAGQWYKLDTASLGAEFKEAMTKVSGTQVSSKELLDYAKENKEVKSDKDGQKKYNVVLDKDKLNKKFAETYEKAMTEAKKSANADSVAEAEEELKQIKDGVFSKDLTLVLYTKDGYVSGVEVDIASLLDNVAGSVKDADAVSELKKMNITGKISVELSDFGKVSKIEIPTAALNAQDATKLLGSM